MPASPAPAPRECPAYFRWIHEDLRPWQDTGVTLDAVEGARRYAPKFRVTVVAGRLYVARYGRCFQTRDVFTQSRAWGILQLLRRYPGRVPDLDLMFDCDDLPVVGAADHRNARPPPPLFRYCGSEETLDIAFPDWSFWGWYKIYIEGRGWSVSEKYILACDSVALMVRPRFHDFFSRGLAPLRHYWPVVHDRGVAMCRSVKFAVDWGKAREIGGNASRFVREDLAMGRVYDYMFHLLTEYARLLRYRPAVPRGAAEVAVESMLRGRRGLVRQFMMDTVGVDDAGGEAGPCRLHPPFSAHELEALRRERTDVVRQVEAWGSH